MAAPEEADSLYGLPLEDFVAQRDALAKRLRAEGRRDDAEAVKALAKPTLAAWAVNQAVRARQAEARELWASGDALGAAQAALLEGRGDAAALREAARAEQVARRPLVEAARGLLTGRGRSLGEGGLERVDQTLHAAAVDPQARGDVAGGRVARELRHVGLGPLAGGGATAQPPADGAPAESRGAGRTAKRRRGAGASTSEQTEPAPAEAQRAAPRRGGPNRAAGKAPERQRAEAKGAEREQGERERAERETARREHLAGARRAVREAEAAHSRAEVELAQAERAAGRATQRLEAARRAEAEARRDAQSAAREERRRRQALERARDDLADLA